MCRDSNSSLQGIPSVWLSNSFMAEGSHSFSPPARTVLVCLSYFTVYTLFYRQLLWSPWWCHTFLWSFGLRAESVINEKNTHTYKKTNSHKTLSCCGKVSRHSLSPSPTLYQSHQMPISTFCSMRKARLRWNCPLPFHIWSWSEGLLEVEASGPINNHTTELRVRQQSADEHVSTKHIVPSLPPLLRRTTLTF